MARTAKVHIPAKIRREKIAESLIALPIVSEKIRAAEIAMGMAEQIAKKTNDEEVKKFILGSVARDSAFAERSREDVIFLRSQIVNHTKHLVLGMSVEEFKSFGDELQKLLAPKMKVAQS